MAAGTENDSQFILSYIKESWPDFPISQHDLDHPTSEFVIAFYQQFRDCINDVIHRMINYNDPPPIEMKTNSDPIFALVCFVNKYLRSLSVTVDIMLTLTDLYEPSAKRTQIRFKVLLALLVFYESKAVEIKDVILKRLVMTEDLAHTKNEKEKVKIELAKQAEDLAHLQDELKKLQKEEEKANLRFFNLQREKEDNDRRQAKLQYDLKALVHTYQNKNVLKTNLVTTTQHLNEQIITEDSYKSLLDLKENLVDKCKELETEAEFSAINLENRKPAIERFENINKQIHVLITNTEELNSLQNLLLSNRAQIQSIEEDNIKNADQLVKLAETDLKYKESISTTKEVMQSETVTSKNEMESIQQSLEQFQMDIYKEEELQCDIARTQEEFQKKINNVTTTIDDLRLDTRELDFIHTNAYKNILNSENEVFNTVNNVLENFAEVLQSQTDAGKKLE